MCGNPGRGLELVVGTSVAGEAVAGAGYADGAEVAVRAAKIAGDDVELAGSVRIGKADGLGSKGSAGWGEWVGWTVGVEAAVVEAAGAGKACWCMRRPGNGRMAVEAYGCVGVVGRLRGRKTG